MPYFLCLFNAFLLIAGYKEQQNIKSNGWGRNTMAGAKGEENGRRQPKYKSKC